MPEVKNKTVRQRIIVIFLLLTASIIVIIGAYSVSAVQETRRKIARSGEASLRIFSESLGAQMSASENHMVNLVQHSEEFRRLGEETSRTQAYLDGYAVKSGFTGIITANKDVSAIMMLSVPNGLFMAQYGNIYGADSDEKSRTGTGLQQEMKNLMSYGPLEFKEWFERDIGGRKYLIRAVRYHSVYICSLIDLQLVMDRAVQLYDFDGIPGIYGLKGEKLYGDSAFSYEDVTKRPENDLIPVSQNKKKYLAVASSTERLNFVYLVPDRGVAESAGTLAPVLTILILLLLIVLPLTWRYMNRTVLMPLNSLVVTMEKISGGELTARSSTIYRNREFKQVNDTFNNMISQITNLKIDSYEKQMEADRAEMAALKMQIRPHFILNCLKNVYAMAETGHTAEIQKLILLLSRHLRYVFSFSADTVALQREIEQCLNYTELCNVGQDRNIVCDIVTDKSLNDFPVPPVSLLTLLENAIKHGYRENSELHVRIAARKLNMEEGPLVNITVSDNGNGFTEEQLKDMNRQQIPAEDNGNHVGISNTLKRFRLLYGEKMAVMFANTKEGGACVDLFFPTSEKTAEGTE
jgi:two-component system sensor histidine kinase YesM